MKYSMLDILLATMAGTMMAGFFVYGLYILITLGA